MENIFWKRGIVFGIIFLFIGASIVTGLDENADLIKNSSLIQKENKQLSITSSEDDVPVWEVCQWWKYKIDDIDIDFEEEGILIHIYGAIDELTLHVVDDSGDSYQVEIQQTAICGNGSFFADLNESGRIDITGELKDTTIEGLISFRKSDLGIEQVNIRISGIFKGKINDLIIELPFAIPIIRFNATINVTAGFDVPYTLIDFPLNTSNFPLIWGLPATNVTVDGTIGSRLQNILDRIYRALEGLPIIRPEIKEILDFFLPVIDIEDLLNRTVGTNIFSIPEVPDILICNNTEMTTVPADTYLAYNISVMGLDGIANLYYAPEAGNIIKILGNFEEVLPFINNIHAELIDTNYDR